MCTEDVPAPKHKKKRAKKETNGVDDTDGKKQLCVLIFDASRI